MILLFLIQKGDKENLLIEVNLIPEKKSKEEKMRKVKEDETLEITMTKKIEKKKILLKIPLLRRNRRKKRRQKKKRKR